MYTLTIWRDHSIWRSYESKYMYNLLAIFIEYYWWIFLDCGCTFYLFKDNEMLSQDERVIFLKKARERSNND